MPEPSILDYLKALLSGRVPPAVPPLSPAKRAARPTRKAPRRAPTLRLASLPWRSAAAFGCFLVAQLLLAPPGGALPLAAALLLLAVGFTVWGHLQGEWRLPKLDEASPQLRPLVFLRTPLLLALAFFAFTLLLTGNNRFNFLNVLCWLLALGFLLRAFWQPAPRRPGVRARLRVFFAQPGWNLQLSRWTLALILAFALVALFRFHSLEALPPEMNSDHAEALLDVMDIQEGTKSIFLLRNGGREPLHFYLVSAAAALFGTGISFTSLKLASALVAFASLAYMYLLGKELGGRWVGLFALLLAGLSYWPNVLARLGLQYALYPALAAPALYYLLRGLRRGATNDFLLAGLCIGLGLNGYAAFRTVPLVAVAAVALFLLHGGATGRASQMRRRAVIGATLLALVALVLFAPLLRYAVAAYATRSPQEYAAPVLQIFAGNLLRGLGMFNYSAGDHWQVGLVGRPAFDLVSAALLLLGACLAVIRYVRRRTWQDLFLLLAIPLMMLPSTVSLAFPQENPAMHRAAGAWVPAFLLCAIGLDALLHGLRDSLKGSLGLRVAQAAGAGVLLLAALLNYRLLFGEYARQYAAHSWNSTEVGQVIADYANSFGSLDSAWVVAYPHWIDTRLVGVDAGSPGRDFAIWPEQLADTLGTPPPKLFVLKPEDTLGLNTLQQLYPQGQVSLHQSYIPTREFLVYLVASDN